MPNRNKVKGTRIERLAVEEFRKHHYEVVRSPSSLGSFDILVNGIGGIQVKYRRNLRNLYKFVNENGIIQTKSGFVVLYLEDFFNKNFKEPVYIKRTFSLNSLSEGCDYILLKSPYKDFLFAMKNENFNAFVSGCNQEHHTKKKEDKPKTKEDKRIENILKHYKNVEITEDLLDF